jgi:RNA polymerase-interacting CarD/CdnL/TRCF family regulator
MEESHVYAEGEWIVHSHFGVGQIKGVEVKSISGDETRYYRIKTTDSTFWVPLDQMNSEVLRPLSTPEEIQRAVATLQKPPKEMSSNTKLRQSRIQSVRMGNTPGAIARLIRDLRARKRDKGILYSSERSAFRTLSERLVQEWAIVTGTKTEVIASELDSLLETPQPFAVEEKQRKDALENNDNQVPISSKPAQEMGSMAETTN